MFLSPLKKVIFQFAKCQLSGQFPQFPISTPDSPTHWVAAPLRSHGCVAAPTNAGRWSAAVGEASNRKGGYPRMYVYQYKYIYIYIVHTYIYIYIIKHSICIFFDDYVYDISILYAFEFVWTKSFDPDTCHDVIIRILINLWLDTVVCLLVRSWV